MFYDLHDLSHLSLLTLIITFRENEKNHGRKKMTEENIFERNLLVRGQKCLAGKMCSAAWP